jgi:hypothetical protein
VGGTQQIRCLGTGKTLRRQLFGRQRGKLGRAGVSQQGAAGDRHASQLNQAAPECGGKGQIDLLADDGPAQASNGSAVSGSHSAGLPASRRAASGCCRPSCIQASRWPSSPAMRRTACCSGGNKAGQS